MAPLEEQTEELILKEQLAERDAKTLSQRAGVLRVYNYYRIILSFLLMILFYEIPGQTFVGALEPEFFQTIVLAYVIFNVGTGFYCLLIQNSERITTPIIVGITTADLVFLTALMLTSGGVESGLDSLLIFAAAFGGVMIHGQISYLFPSTALLLCFASATYTRFLGVNDSLQHFFEVALLGTAAFAVNALLQYVADQLKKQEMKVVSLSTLEKMRVFAEKSRVALEEQYDRFNVLLIATSEGVLGLDRLGDIIFANPRACELLNISHENLINRNIQNFMVQTPEARDPSPIFALLEVDPNTDYEPERWTTNLGENFIVDMRLQKQQTNPAAQQVRSYYSKTSLKKDRKKSDYNT